jgi:hypothetical protein
MRQQIQLGETGGDSCDLVSVWCSSVLGTVRMDDGVTQEHREGYFPGRVFPGGHLRSAAGLMFRAQ